MLKINSISPLKKHRFKPLSLALVCVASSLSMHTGNGMAAGKDNPSYDYGLAQNTCLIAQLLDKDTKQIVRVARNCGPMGSSIALFEEKFSKYQKLSAHVKMNAYESRYKDNDERQVRLSVNEHLNGQVVKTSEVRRLPMGAVIELKLAFFDLTLRIDPDNRMNPTSGVYDPQTSRGIPMGKRSKTCQATSGYASPQGDASDVDIGPPMQPEGCMDTNNYGHDMYNQSPAYANAWGHAPWQASNWATMDLEDKRRYLYNAQGMRVGQGSSMNSAAGSTYQSQYPQSKMPVERRAK